ncbi:MAG: nucleotide sugar dehydrogenase [Acidobacteriia bacterium]|nr:nucleotide sugar dehydrogenase [Terriglobia bacterium]
MADIVIIGGCGHVGLPLGLAFALAGRSVVAVDIDAEKVARTNQGVMPFVDAGADRCLPEVLRKKTFTATTSSDAIRDADTVITVVGTPLDEHLNPRLEVYSDLIRRDRSRLRDGQLLVLRSTVYPGTTDQVAHALERAGFDLDVAFCPERVAEGVALEEIHSLPQIVSGTTPRAERRAADLFGLLTPDVIGLPTMAAELTKLYNNAWRYIQFAVANQFYMIANDCGLDFHEIHRAMTEKYPRARGFPRAGFAAGPCLFKDTMQLATFNNNAFFLGHSAMLVNEGLPNYLVRRVTSRYDLREMTVGILGMTFKADSDDPRDSLSFKLRKCLVFEAKEVLCADPYLDRPWILPAEEVVERSGLLFVGAPHRAYKALDMRGKTVIDVWNSVPGGVSVV